MAEFDILKNLVPWMKSQPIKYPWQIDTNAYRVWVSEVMLQQTVVTAVVGFYKRWMARFPSVYELAEASEEEVLRTFEGLGYYSRARNMHRCAQVVVSEYDGEFPKTYDELIKLPGIGDYTARAVLSFAYGADYLLVDANVKRILRRFALQEEWTPEFEIKYLSSLSSASADEKRHINEGIMRLGQEICLKSKPLCLICPLTSSCLAREQGRQDIVSPKKREVTLLSSVLYLFIKESQVYLSKGEKGRFKGFYVFPKAELKDEDSLDILKGMGYYESLGSYTHTYTRFRESLQVIMVDFSKIQESDPSLTILTGGEWTGFSIVDSLPFPSVYRKIWSDFLNQKGINSVI